MFLKNSKLFIISIISLLFIQRTFSETAKFEPYGFLKTSVMYGTDPILSFSNTNMVAPTSAANKGLYTQGNDRTSFQVAQSRLGTKINGPQDISGLLEIDFIDFSQSSPTTQTRPRLRRIYVEKKFSDSFSVQVGQDWDTFSPFRPDTYDIIGLYFNGGNIGFMREQIKVKKKIKKVTLEVALGQANKNTNLGNNQVEEDNQLSLAFNVKGDLGEKSSIALSGITGKMSYNNTQNQTPYGVALGYQCKGLGKDEFSKLTFEGYYGKGLSNLNLLDLPGDTYAESLGGYITYQRELYKDYQVRLGQGFAKRSLAGASVLSTNKSYSNLGLNENLVSRFSLTRKFSELQVYSEFSHFESSYDRKSKSNTLEVGFFFPF